MSRGGAGRVAPGRTAQGLRREKDHLGLLLGILLPQGSCTLNPACSCLSLQGEPGRDTGGEGPGLPGQKGDPGPPVSSRVCGGKQRVVEKQQASG